MRLGKKWAIQSGIFALLATVTLLLVVNFQLRQYAIQEAEEKAKLILQEKQATIKYVIKDLRPGLFKLIKENEVPLSYFEPSWMSATYINRVLMQYFNNSVFREYYYKNATVNARSPENEADQYEKAFLEKVRNNNETGSWSDIVNFEGKPFFIYMQPNSAKFSEGCMRCHSIPENAPTGLISLYGSERSFHKKIGEVPSVLSLRIPLAEVYASINTLTIALSLFICAILSIIFFVQWLFVKKTLIVPIKTITAKSSSIANDEKLLGENISIPGNNELAEMAHAFSDMSQKLARSKDKLETLVEERTRQLSKSRDQSQRYLNISGVMFTALNRSGEITLLNQKGCDILGVTEQEALGLNWFDNFLPEPIVEEVKKVFDQLMQGEIDAVEFYENPVVTRSGEKRLIAFHNTLLTEKTGLITGLLWAGEDITEKRLVKKEKEKLEAQLRQSHKMEAIGTLAGGIAHDFNNILSVILGYADMAKDTIPATSPAKEQIEHILTAGNRAKDLVKHILAFSRKEAQKRVPVPIDLIVIEALKLLRASIPATIEIRQNIEPSCGNILAEPTQIHQVLLNLCTNAAQAMDEEGGILQVDLTSVELGTGNLLKEPSLKPGPYIHLAVKDNGMGIDKKHLARIFDPYFTTKDVGKGSGMGLAVVIGIIKSHDGMITVQSRPGEGTVFNVYFPRIAGKTQEENSDIEPSPTGKERILVVDDEESIVYLTARILKDLGYQVTTQTNSLAALELIRSQQNFFDLVITDQTMPGLTGDQLAKNIMALSPDTAIILCTGYSSRMDAQKAAFMGINAFVMKPVNNTEFATTIRLVLDKRKGECT